MYLENETGYHEFYNIEESHKCLKLVLIYCFLTIARLHVHILLYNIELILDTRACLWATLAPTHWSSMD